MNNLLHFSITLCIVVCVICYSLKQDNKIKQLESRINLLEPDEQELEFKPRPVMYWFTNSGLKPILPEGHNKNKLTTYTLYKDYLLFQAFHDSDKHKDIIKKILKHYPISEQIEDYNNE